MPSNTNQYSIGQGTATTEDTDYVVQETGTTGTPGALRSLSHPDPASAALTYFRNPDRILNFLHEPLVVPEVAYRQTFETTLPFVSERGISDVIVTEEWTGSNRRAAMPASFLKLLYELHINRPATGQFVIWNPADLVSDGTRYYVTLGDLRVGGRSLVLDVKEWGADQLVGLDVVKTGVIDRTVEHDLLIRSVVP